MVHATVEHLELHYADLKAKSFFPGLVKYMASGESVFARVGIGGRGPSRGEPGLGDLEASVDRGRSGDRLMRFNTKPAPSFVLCFWPEPRVLRWGCELICPS
jgi:hypothetical protein